MQKNTRHHLDRISRIFKRIVPIYWAFLTYILLGPGNDRAEDWVAFEGLDKVVHFVVFAILSFSLKAAFPKMRMIVLYIIIIIYGIATEVLQGSMNLGRSMEFADFVADLLGAITGYLLFKTTIRFLGVK